MPVSEPPGATSPLRVTITGATGLIGPRLIDARRRAAARRR